MERKRHRIQRHLRGDSLREVTRVSVGSTVDGCLVEGKYYRGTNNCVKGGRNSGTPHFGSLMKDSKRKDLEGGGSVNHLSLEQL